MQKKYFLIFVVILAFLSTVLFISRNNSMFRMMDGFLGSDYMMDDIGVGGGIVSEQIEPMGYAPDIGIMPPYYGDDALYATERFYEKSSYHSVVVSNVDTYIRGLKEYFASIDAIILNSSMSSYDKYDSASLFVKVPVDSFDEATIRISQDVKKVVDESISSSDITGQVVNTQDTVIALQEQKALKEAQLKDATTEVEKSRIQIEINRLDRQIEAAQKAQENVESRTLYASMSVTAASSEKYFNPGTVGDFDYEFQRAWESLKSFIKVLLVFGIWLAVYSIIWAPIIWLVGKIVKKFRKSI
jgi:hypothetical protein